MIANETNLYALLEFGIELKCSKEDILFKLAWSQESKLVAITDSQISRLKFEKLKKYLHFSESYQRRVSDKLDKIRVGPFLSILKTKVQRHSPRRASGLR